MPEVATPPPAAPPATSPPAAPATTPARDNTPIESPQLEAAYDAKFPESEGDEPELPKPSPERRPTKPADKPVEKPAAAKPTDKPADEFALPKDVAESKDLKRLREFAYAQNKNFKTLEKETAALKAKIAEYEQTVPKTIQERDALAAKISSAEKQVASYEERMRLLDFKQSDEYRTKYEQPYIKAFGNAAQEITNCQLQYDDPSGEIDQETGQVKKLTRAGTQNDLAYLLTLERPIARREAKKHFPEDWEDVMAHYDKIVPLRNSAFEAEKGYKENWKSIQQDNIARQAAAQKQTEEAWDKVNSELAEKNPEFALREDDPEGNALLEKGFTIADLFFSDERDKLSLDKKVLLDAHVRNRFAAHPRLIRDLKAAQAKIAQLESTISELRGSKPGAPRPVSAEAPATEPDEGALAAFDRKM